MKNHKVKKSKNRSENFVRHCTLVKQHRFEVDFFETICFEFLQDKNNRQIRIDIKSKEF